MTIGQSVLIDTQLAGLITDAVSTTNVVIAITAPLSGSFSIADGDGNTVLSKGPGQSGAFAVAGQVDRIEYLLTSAADLGLVTVAFRPI